MFFEAIQDEYGGTIGEVVTTISGLAYTPDLQPVGSGSAGTYYPRDTSADASALNYLGFFPDPLLAAHVGTKGSAAADRAAGVGAWSPMFQQAVKDFQIAYRLTADGWVGPQTRTKIGEEVAKKNASGGLVIPPPPIPNIPNGPSPSPGPQPVSTKSDNTIYWIAGGALALLGIGYAVTR